MTTAMDIDKTDFYSFELLLNDDERAVLHGVRGFMRSEVAPIVNEHWSKSTFPFEVVPGLQTTRHRRPALPGLWLCRPVVSARRDGGDGARAVGPVHRHV